MKLGIDARTGVYECSVAIIMFAAGAVTIAAGEATLFSAVVGAGVAALVSFTIRRAVPSPQTRADREELARLKRELAALGAKFHDPQRIVREDAELNRRRRFGKIHGSRDAGPLDW